MSTSTNKPTTETTIAETELKPCPFCGGAAGYIPYTAHNGVRCLTISCPLSIPDRGMTKAQWNTRVPVAVAEGFEVERVGALVTNLLNEFHGSGHCGVDNMVSARLRGCEKCAVFASVLDRALAVKRGEQEGK